MRKNNENDPSGDVQAFDENWRKRPETQYIHWTRGEPENQIQLAFRRHWLTFQRLIGERCGARRCLEVGCGRGSLSAYFADNQWECTLLDLSSAAIEQAKEAFHDNGLHAKFDIGDCMQLPYDEGSYDLIFSIGLLEHFTDIEKVIREQYRVLAPDGLFIGYVVPELKDNIQADYEWINDLLKAILPNETLDANRSKTDVFRSDSLSPPYLKVMEKVGFIEICHQGAYPLPMISHSPEFPFSLLPAPAETSLVRTFQTMLDQREKETGEDPWLCSEDHGQAFLIWGRKPS